MSAEDLDFPDHHFDMVYSIATLEHVQNPIRALEEMLRVTKLGGHVYVQAGPLYHSPYGHHMFGYFQDQPWIHLQKSAQDIIRFAKCNNVDKKIEKDLGVSVDQYVMGMLTREHINGLFYSEYGLEAFRGRLELRVLKYAPSYEGEELLTAERLGALAKFNKSDLTAHGFELAFERIA